ncbi:hypothetical protein AAE478_005067 [Parahypoxylon ruwenzoriense]
MPPLTGPYTIGTTDLEIIDYSRLDLRAPTRQPRDLMVSLFYPVNSISHQANNHPDGHKCTPTKQFSDLMASLFESQLGLPNGTLHNVLTRACLDAPLAHPSLPLLIFTPGQGGPRQGYSQLLAEIASYGWNIVSLDHPYESSIVEYPDGRVVYYQIPTNMTDSEQYKFSLENVEIRTADVISVLNALSNSTVTAKIPGMRNSDLGKSVNHQKGFRTDTVGVFGQSLGGATSLRVTENDARFRVGANVDGRFWGPEEQIGTDVPFVVLAAEDHNRTVDQSWADTWPNLRDFKREYRISDVLHLGFTDLPTLRDLRGRDNLPPLDDTLGTINGTRIIGIQRALLTSLFKRFLNGENDGLLDGVGLGEWPEVTNIE